MPVADKSQDTFHKAHLPSQTVHREQRHFQPDIHLPIFDKAHTVSPVHHGDPGFATDCVIDFGNGCGCANGDGMICGMSLGKSREMTLGRDPV